MIAGLKFGAAALAKTDLRFFSEAFGKIFFNKSIAPIIRSGLACICEVIALMIFLISFASMVSPLIDDKFDCSPTGSCSVAAASIQDRHVAALKLD